jgi:hypothetical protein
MNYDQYDDEMQDQDEEERLPVLSIKSVILVEASCPRDSSALLLISGSSILGTDLRKGSWSNDGPELGSYS